MSSVSGHNILNRTVEWTSMSSLIELCYFPIPCKWLSFTKECEPLFFYWKGCENHPSSVNWLLPPIAFAFPNDLNQSLGPKITPYFSLLFIPIGSDHSAPPRFRTNYCGRYTCGRKPCEPTLADDTFADTTLADQIWIFLNNREWTILNFFTSFLKLTNLNTHGSSSGMPSQEEWK
jgi:hypothetical protein